MKTSLLRARPHLWYQLYWVLYLIWFFWLDPHRHRPELYHPQPSGRFHPLQRVVHLSRTAAGSSLLAGVTAPALVVRHRQAMISSA
ncbi:MAG: hypothetical protein ACLVJH_18300 [Faecalibacterium prausnitzii]